MKKTIFILTILLAGLLSVSFAQTDVESKYYDAGVVYYSYFSDVDSTGIYYSKWFDATLIDNSSPLLSAYYYTVGANNDTVSVIIQGAIPYEYGYLIYALDTVDVQGDNSYNITSSATKLALLRTAPTTLTTNSKYLPMWRFVVKERAGQDEPNRSNGAVAISLYAPTVDYIPERVGLGYIK